MLAGNQFVYMEQVQCNFCGSTSSGTAREGRVVWPPRAAESNGRKKGQQNKYFEFKKKILYILDRASL